jgi:hypothetical protein
MSVVRVGLICTAVLTGCGGALPALSTSQTPETVLEQARARPSPDPVQARYHLKIRSKPMELAGSTGGALIFDRPGQGHLAVLGPLGAPLVTLTSDGTGLAVDLVRDRRHLLGLDAETVMREVTGGIVGIDDLFGILIGDIPLDEARIKSQVEREDGTAQLVLQGPRKSTLMVILNPETGTPISMVAIGKAGRRLLVAEYEPFVAHDGDQWVPSVVHVEVPQLELTVDLRFKWWKTLDAVPDVFSLDAPDGVRSESLEEVMGAWSRNLLGGLR